LPHARHQFPETRAAEYRRAWRGLGCRRQGALPARPGRRDGHRSHVSPRLRRSATMGARPCGRNAAARPCTWSAGSLPSVDTPSRKIMGGEGYARHGFLTYLAALLGYGGTTATPRQHRSSATAALPTASGRIGMKRPVRTIVSACVIAGGALLTSASPATAHCVDTSVGFVDLSPGHFAAAGGHQAAIDNSGGTVGTGCEAPELNPAAPSDNPEVAP